MFVDFVPRDWVDWGSPMVHFKFEERRLDVWAFVRTRNRDTFCWVAMSVLDRFSCDATKHLYKLRSVMAATGDSRSVIVFFGGSNVLADIYTSFLGSGKQQNLGNEINYPIVDLRLLKRTQNIGSCLRGSCLQNIPSSVFGSLDPLFLIKFVIFRMKGVEQRDCMMSRFSRGFAIITGELSMQSLVEVFVKNVSVRPFISVVLKGRWQEIRCRQFRGITHSWLVSLSYRICNFIDSFCFKVKELLEAFL